MSSSEIKIFKISGKYIKNHQRFTFTKYVRALSEDNALEKVLTLVTASNVLRRKVAITEKKVISLEECPDLYVRGLTNI